MVRKFLFSKNSKEKLQECSRAKSRARSGKKAIAIFMAVLMSLTICTSGVAFAGQTKSELQDELSDVNKEKEDVSNEMAQVEKDIKELQSKVDSLSSQISEASSEIKETEEKIEKKEKEMEEREDNLYARLRVMYKNGSIGFVDVLLGSGSISEFVSNLELIQKIYKNDMNVLKVLEEEYEELKDIKAELKEKKASLAEQQTELTAQKSELDEKRSQLKKEEEALKAEADQLTQEILSMIDTSSTYVGGTFVWPCPSSTYITSSFGNRLHPILKSWIYHTGVDIGASSGKNILAAASGTVIMAGWYGGYGNCVMIDHGGGIVTLYGHASALNVSKGQTVSQGQVIAYVGSTGRSTGPHLHFEVRVNGQYVNPMSYFS
jgi:murein DD-endopeptidase MepM/ murein hydrolase activator NlpD